MFAFFVDFGSPGDNFGGHFGVLEHPEAPKGHAMDPKMPPGRDLENFGTFPRRKAPPLLEHFFVFCVFVSLLLCSTEKVSQKDSQKDLPGGPQEGSRLGGSSFFTFAAEPKKDSKMGAKMERLGSQSLHYTTFWRIF